ncbi:MAG: hypothetical protein QNJ13_02615 [Paracoccaceae bacterium]|nr:hypothetical protein [Paracoccaceae bacterium]
MADIDRAVGAGFGWFAFLAGALALLAAVTVFWAGPFAPQQSASVGLGEMAAEIARSAARSAVGMEQPAPEPVVRDIDDYLQIGIGVLGAVAVILGVAGVTVRGGVRASIGGAVLGGLAIAFQFFTFYAMALLGVLLVMAIIYSLKDVFGDMFGGFFGG